MSRTAKSPLFRKCDKIIIAAATVIGLTVAAGSAFAGPSAVGNLPVLSQSYVSDAAKRGFNPQPEPPKVRIFGSNAGAVMFNPQPEPPKLRIFGNGAGAVMFNPQPEPPAPGMPISR